MYLRNGRGTGYTEYDFSKTNRFCQENCFLELRILYHTLACSKKEASYDMKYYVLSDIR
jgi:hypothetical protein